MTTTSKASGTWSAVAVVALWQVIASLCYYSVFPATDAFQSAFSLSGLRVGLIITVLTLGYTVFLLPAGAFVDAYGDRPAMVVGLVGLAVGTLGVSLAHDYPSVLVGAFVLGSAYSTAMPATNVAVSSRAPSGRYNAAVGLKQVGVTAGSALAALVVAGLAAFSLPWEAGFDLAGVVAALAAVGFFVAYDGTGGGGDVRLPDVRGVLDNASLVALLCAGFFVGATVFTTTGYTVPFLRSDTTATASVAGLVLSLTQVTGSVGRLAGGSLADRLPRRAAVASTGVLCLQVGIGVVAVAALPLAGMPGTVGVFAVLGFGFLGVTGLYHGTLVALAGPEESGAVSAIGQTTLNFGGLLVPPLFGFLADATGYATGWRLLAVCGGLGAVCAWLSIRNAT